jgi:hypothetical protein
MSDAGLQALMELGGWKSHEMVLRNARGARTSGRQSDRTDSGDRKKTHVTYARKTKRLTRCVSL